MENITLNNVDYFTQLFKNNFQYINKRGNGILNNPREQALTYFNQLGIPTKKNENYKYSDINPFFTNICFIPYLLHFFMNSSLS